MKRYSLQFAGCALATVLSATRILAADPLTESQSVKAAAITPNAAVVYWQAFAMMPSLNDEQKQKLDAAAKITTAPLTDDLKPIVLMFETSLREMHRARLITVCDWQLDDEAGPKLFMPHLQNTRDLSRAALLRARLQFAAGETDAAVADVIAVLKMARDCGVSPVVISMLVDVAIEKTAIEVLAAALPNLTPEQLDQLTTALKQLPPTASLAESLHWEANTWGAWIGRVLEAEAVKLNDPKAGAKVIAAIMKQLVGGDGVQPQVDDVERLRREEMLQSMSVADVREALRRMQTDYEELAKIAGLSSVEQSSRFAEFELQLTESRKLARQDDLLRYFSVSFLPSVGKVGEREEQLHVLRDLMKLAVQVQRHGPAALKSALLIGGAKVQYHKTESSFELRHQYPASDKAEVLTVGSNK